MQFLPKTASASHSVPPSRCSQKCALRLFPSLASAREAWQRENLSKQIAFSFLSVIYWFSPNLFFLFFFSFFLIAKPSSCSLLSRVSFKNNFSQVLLPPHCELFIVPCPCCFSMGDPTSYLKFHVGCIVPPLLDTCEELSCALLFFFFSPSERLQRRKGLLCSFDFRGETGATFYELLSSEQLVSCSLCPVLIPVEHYSAGWISFPYRVRKQQAELSKTAFK